MNHVSLIGNVTRDLELKTYEKNNKKGKYVSFSIAISEMNPKNKEKITTFVDVVAFDKKAEILSQYVSKGSKIAIEGRLKVGSYANEDGKNIKKVSIIVNDFTFADNKKIVNGDNNISSEEVPF